jgi:hypothetical protein
LKTRDDDDDQHQIWLADLGVIDGLNHSPAGMGAIGCRQQLASQRMTDSMPSACSTMANQCAGAC